MTHAWTAAGSHSVQFYESEPFIHHAIAQFLTEGARPGDPLILLARPSTFKGVAEHVASGRYGPAIDAAERIHFIDAEAALPHMMDGGAIDSARAERLFRHVLSQTRPDHAQGTIRLYGEIVDLLCQRGRHATAVEFEELASVLLKLEPQLSILCGYAMERFKDDANATHFRSVCQKHSHVVPAEGFSDALRTRYQQSVMLQHNAFDLTQAARSHPNLRTADGAAPAHTVYVIEDNASLRRSLERLLNWSNWPVRTFESAEAFLTELPTLSHGCLLVDIELPGMSGFDLVRRLKEARSSWPIIVMSALHDKKIESEALRLGARACLPKPFDTEVLLDAIAQALL
jgi:CheY-like chemotaxis protein